MSSTVYETSVIIPVYNDSKELRTTAQSLLDQSCDAFEVVIADNGSSDETAAIARKCAQRGYVTHVVEDDVQSSYAARNAGIEASV